MGIYNEEKVIKCLRNTHFITDNKKYFFIKLPFSDYCFLIELLGAIKEPFFEIVYDKNEITLVVEESVWTILKNKLHPIKVDYLLGLITCDATEDNPTGYLLKVMEVLSPHNVGVYVQGAYTTDNILVDYKDLDKALNLLQKTFN